MHYLPENPSTNKEKKPRDKNREFSTKWKKITQPLFKCKEITITLSYRRRPTLRETLKKN